MDVKVTVQGSGFNNACPLEIQSRIAAAIECQCSLRGIDRSYVSAVAVQIEAGAGRQPVKLEIVSVSCVIDLAEIGGNSRSLALASNVPVT